MSLIGLMCKRGDTFSLQVLIGRGLFLLILVKLSSSSITFALFSSSIKSVLIAMRSHPFPFRTRKLSSLTLMILGWRRPGKVKRCRYFIKRKLITVSFFLIRTISSVGQSSRLITGRSGVRVPDGPPR